MQISSQQQGAADLTLVVMRPQNFPFFFLAAGVVAAVALTRKGQHPQLSAHANLGHRAPRPAPRRFVLAKDVPSLDLRQGERLRVEPEALIYLGDVVALKSEDPEVVLARFHDELMHCVDGLVVREAQPHPSV